jgi:cobalt-zinc-cadmium efflux system protein
MRLKKPLTGDSDTKRMGHDHNHSDSDHYHGHNRLGIALVITAVYMVVEAAGGVFFNSLALLADAGHMLSDVMALGLSWVAIRIGRKSPSDTHTFGFKRSEILAALLNGLALWLIVVMIFYEAIKRFFNPEPVVAGGMLVVAAVGLGVNALMAVLLFSSRKENLNLKSAFLHVISDAIGSVGAILAAVVIVYTGAYWTDPLVSVFVGLLILYSSWDLIKESVRILMEGVPYGINITEIENAMQEQAGVCCVHDLHVWTISGSRTALAAHVVLCGPDEDQEAVLAGLNRILEHRFEIDHTTIQIEPSHETPKYCRENSCRPGTVCRVSEELNENHW